MAYTFRKINYLIFLKGSLEVASGFDGLMRWLPLFPGLSKNTQQPPTEERTASPGSFSTFVHVLVGQEPVPKPATDKENGIAVIGSTNSWLPPEWEIGSPAGERVAHAPSPEGGWAQPQNQSSRSWLWRLSRVCCA